MLIRRLGRSGLVSLRWTRDIVRSREIDLERAMMAGEGRLSAARWAELTDDPRRAAMRLRDSPHVALLKEYVTAGDRVFGPESFQRSPYFQNALSCVRVHGHYFGQSSPEGITA
jgi:hypothetical protein